MRGRRGAIETGELLLLLLGIVFVAIVVTYLIKVKSAGDAVGSQFPADTQAAITACKNSGSELLRQAYCDQLRPATLEGQKQEVTCAYLVTKYSDALPTTAVDCSTYFGTGKTVAEQGIAKCRIAFKNGEVSSDTVINGVVCATKECGDGLDGLGGTLTLASACLAPQKAITKGFFLPAGSSSQVCCVTV